MNLKEYRKTYYELSGKASDIARQLAFAGIALIWVFKTQNADGAYVLGRELLVSGALIIFALACDLLQYVAGTLIWGWYARYKEKQGVKPTALLRAPRYFTWPALGFFWAKIVLVVAAYAVLLGFVWAHLACTTPVVP